MRSRVYWLDVMLVREEKMRDDADADACEQYWNEPLYMHLVFGGHDQ